MAENSRLINFSGVSKIYGHGATQVKAIDDVDIAIHQGEFIAVMGSSGSGKSTCMNIIGCLDTPTGGLYQFNGIDVSTLSRDQLALLRRHYLGFVFQGFNLMARTSALENVELPLIYRGIQSSKRRAKALEALAAVGLEGRGHHSPSELSGGEQQRVAIARSIVSDPVVMLADEPTGNLDSVRSKEIMELMKSLNEDRGITIVMVTHESDMAAYASRTLCFQDGHVADSVSGGAS